MRFQSVVCFPYQAAGRLKAVARASKSNKRLVSKRISRCLVHAHRVAGARGLAHETSSLSLSLAACWNRGFIWPFVKRCENRLRKRSGQLYTHLPFSLSLSLSLSLSVRLLVWAHRWSRFWSHKKSVFFKRCACQSRLGCRKHKVSNVK